MGAESTRASRPGRSGGGTEHPSRFEYRVWGRHRRARKLLREMADEAHREQIVDCYLLVDDPAWNAKVRDNRLKIKRLVDERKGFEQWSSERPETLDAIPSPLDEALEGLDIERLRKKKKFRLSTALEGLDPDGGVRAIVFVSKTRRVYRIGDLRAEVTDIEIMATGEVLRTVSIEGDDLRELVKLRKRLGLKGEANTPVHQAIDVALAS